jgi:hypothetical protein
VNHSTFISSEQAYDRGDYTNPLEIEMSVKIVRGTLLALMVVGSLTLFGAVVII